MYRARQSIVIPTTFAAFLLLAMTACSGGGQPDAAASPGAFPPADVQTVTLAPTPIPQTSEYVATIRSLRSITVQPQVEGVVRQVLVRAGDQVRAGQALVQIDPERQQAAVAAAESQRVSREADVAFTGQQLARMQKLLDAGAVSLAELEQAQNAAKTAQAQLDAVVSQIREGQVQLDYYRVTAPSSGTIGDIAIREGDRVTQSTAITTIDQLLGFEVYINVPLERASALRIGLPVELLSPDGTIIATEPITFISPRADDATQSVLVKATLRQIPSSIRVMQYVKARVVWSNDPQLTVPVGAVNRISGQFFVFVVEDSPQGEVARQTPVLLGELIGDVYVVASGLKAGDRIITSNLQKLGDGAPVKPA